MVLSHTGFIDVFLLIFGDFYILVGKFGEIIVVKLFESCIIVLKFRFLSAYFVLRGNTVHLSMHGLG